MERTDQSLPVMDWGERCTDSAPSSHAPRNNTIFSFSCTCGTFARHPQLLFLGRICHSSQNSKHELRTKVGVLGLFEGTKKNIEEWTKSS